MKLNIHFSDICEALINKGAETSCRDDIQWTPLDYAAMNGHPKTIGKTNHSILNHPPSFLLRYLETPVRSPKECILKST